MVSGISHNNWSNIVVNNEAPLANTAAVKTEVRQPVVTDGMDHGPAVHSSVAEKPGMLAAPHCKSAMCAATAAADFDVAIVTSHSDYAAENLAKLENVGWYQKMSADDKELAKDLITAISDKAATGDVSGDNCNIYYCLSKFLDGENSFSFVDEAKKDVARDIDKWSNFSIKRSFISNTDAIIKEMGRTLGYSFGASIKEYDKNQDYKDLTPELKLAFIDLSIKLFDGTFFLTQTKIMSVSLVDFEVVKKMAFDLITSDSFKAMDDDSKLSTLKEAFNFNKMDTFGSFVSTVKSDVYNSVPEADKINYLSLVSNMTQAANSAGDYKTRFDANNLVSLIKSGDISVKFDASIENYSLTDNVLTINPGIKSFDAQIAQLSAKGCSSLKAQIANIGSIDDLQALPKFQKLSEADKAVVLDAVNLASDDAKTVVMQKMATLITAESFNKQSAGAKSAILAQCKNYPHEEAINTLTYMTNTEWFNIMSTQDKQRSAKTLAHTVNKSVTGSLDLQKSLAINSVERIIDDSIPLTFVTIYDDPGAITGGYAMPDRAGIYLNNRIVTADNEPFKKVAFYDVSEVICHEVSHQVNGDANCPDYKYFQAEYRAWYVGIVASTGKIPTRQEAFDRCVGLFKLYPNINKALRAGNEESVQVKNFLQQFFDKPIKAGSDKEINKLLEKKVSNGKGEAPIPDPSLNPDMDN